MTSIFDQTKMIRGNWSLAQEFKQNERKQQSRVQQRQKHQHKLEKLKNIDPIKLYNKIKNLESKESGSDRDEDHLKSLQEDWTFIEKHGLHKVKIKKFLEEKGKQERHALRLKNKLWASKSIYFNPELNPLGKVPNIANLDESVAGELKNLTIPLRDRTHYEPDPLIAKLNVKLPDGNPPKFYKLIQNTARSKMSGQEDIKKTSLETETSLSNDTYLEQLLQLSNSDQDHVSDELELDKGFDSTNEPNLKKIRYK